MAKTATARSKKKNSQKEAGAPKLRVVSDPQASRQRLTELLGLALLTAAVLLGLALTSYQPVGPGWPSAEAEHNLIGPVGALLADLLFAGLGVGAYLLTGGLLATGILCFRPRRPRLRLSQAAGVVITLLGASTIAHISLDSVIDIAYPPGGLLGAMLGDSLARVLAPVGTCVLAAAAVASGLLLATDTSLAHLVAAVGDGLRSMGEWGVDAVQIQRERLRLRREKRAEQRGLAHNVAAAAEEAEYEERQSRTQRRSARRDKVKRKAQELAEADLQKEREHAAQIAEQEVLSAQAPTYEEAAATDPGSPAPAVVDDDGSVSRPRSILDDPPWVQDLRRREQDLASSTPDEIASAKIVPFTASTPPRETDTSAPHKECVGEIAAETQATPRAETSTPRIIALKDADAVKDLVDESRDERPKPFGETFELPPLHLLNYDAPEQKPLDESALNEQARKLTKIFKDYGIEGTVREIRPGPVVTTYEFVPKAGTRIAKIASLADDLAMAMEAIRVRVVAPIPGKGAVGIEIPNEQRQAVYLKEIIASKGFQRSSSKLAMAIGKDIEGRPVQADLAKMPHMLIAGTTGSGKSVAINTLITSILYKATPDEVRFLMIDPKMLELSIYEGIPHLLLPPVTDPKKAAAALYWAVSEMERRYQLLADSGVRDIASYNKKVDAQLVAARDVTPVESVAKEAAPEFNAGKKVIIHDERKGADSSNEIAESLERMPYIVVVVDEFADLMMVAPRDVETYIARLAQKARACGIHVLLATQRPSTDVITGVIKANFPVRMSFQVASPHDSKTIINGYGAEKLLGKGDMLMIPPGAGAAQRNHGAFVSEVEIGRVVEFWKSQGAPSYDESILKAAPNGEGGDGDGDNEEYDEHFDAAVALVAEAQQVSISMIQRKLKIGYNRAARIVECMERDGMVGPQLPGNKPREVFVKPVES